VVVGAVWLDSAIVCRRGGIERMLCC
jgi:hypothetical protein